jgi:preprotein translocase subunit SecY
MDNMTAPGKRKCLFSFMTTAILVGLYWLGHHISLPGIHRAVLSSISESKAGIFTLGYRPFVIGFTFVELFSFVLPAWRLMRIKASEGRRKLNIASIVAGLVVCAFQGLMVAIVLERTTLLLVPNPGWHFRLMVCATLLGGTILVFFIAMLISWGGIANGFCILIAADILTPIFRQLGISSGDFQKLKPISWSECFVAIVLVTVLIAYYRKTATAKASIAESGFPVNFQLPSFPQGIPPLIWAIGILSLPSLIRNVTSPGPSDHLVGFWTSLLGTTVLIVIFSAIGVALFSSKKRLMHNLPAGVRLNGDIERLLRNQVIKGTVVLGGSSAILLGLERLLDLP